jgi:hypothetical protein
MQLDLDAAWSEQISRQLEAARRRGFFGWSTMPGSRWRAVTMSHTASTTSRSCWQRSTSTRHGRPATELERRLLMDEFIEEITVLPDYLDVKVHGAPPLHVLTRRLDSRSRVLIVSEGGLQPASVGCNPVHLIVYKVEPPICVVFTE